MAKLGYTWYPKDWNNSDSVFELNLEQRGLYRELIDIAMLTDNKIDINHSIWSRRWCIDLDKLNTLLDELVRLKLIEIKDKLIFIPSCESRLKLVRGGRDGGKKSKPTSKPDSKPTIKPTIKPKVKQTKKKLKGKEKKDIQIDPSIYRSFDHLSITKDECNSLAKLGYTKMQIDEKINALQNRKDNHKYKTIYLTIWGWLKKDYPLVENPEQPKKKFIVPHWNESLPANLGDGTPA
jgi:hypothetical protein